MTKSELIQTLAEVEGITLKAVKAAVDTVFDGAADSPARIGRVEIRGVGSLKSWQIKKKGRRTVVGMSC